VALTAPPVLRVKALRVTDSAPVVNGPKSMAPPVLAVKDPPVTDSDPAVSGSKVMAPPYPLRKFSWLTARFPAVTVRRLNCAVAGRGLRCRVALRPWSVRS